MESCLAKIFGKPSDYKICPFCMRVNWYENDYCVSCNAEIEYVNTPPNEVRNWCEQEYEFWIKDEGYQEGEADEICYGI